MDFGLASVNVEGVEAGREGGVGREWLISGVRAMGESVGYVPYGVSVDMFLRCMLFVLLFPRVPGCERLCLLLVPRDEYPIPMFRELRELQRVGSVFARLCTHCMDLEICPWSALFYPEFHHEANDGLGIDLDGRGTL